MIPGQSTNHEARQPSQILLVACLASPVPVCSLPTQLPWCFIEVETTEDSHQNTDTPAKTKTVGSSTAHGIGPVLDQPVPLDLQKPTTRKDAPKEP